MSRLSSDPHPLWQIARGATASAATLAAVIFTVAFVRPCHERHVEAAVFAEFALIPSAVLSAFIFLRERSLTRAARTFLLWAAALAFVAAILVPDLFGASGRSRQVRALGQMRTLGSEISAGQHITAPLDPWGHQYLITIDKHGYTIISFGECGVPDQPPGTSYSPGTTTSYSSDIVFSNGLFLRYPEGVQE